jgi:hypothetical protein
VIDDGRCPRRWCSVGVLALATNTTGTATTGRAERPARPTVPTTAGVPDKVRPLQQRDRPPVVLLAQRGVLRGSSSKATTSRGQRSAVKSAAVAFELPLAWVELVQLSVRAHVSSTMLTAYKAHTS